MSVGVARCHARWLAVAEQPGGLALVLVVALLLKLVFMVMLADKPPNVDGLLYLRAAEVMMDEGPAAARQIYPMPAYPFMLGLVHAIVPDWVWSARVIAMLSLVGATWVLYRLAADMFGRRAAFWAALAFAIAPMPNEMTVLVYRGPVYLFTFALAVWWMARCFAHPGTVSILAALLAGALAPLFRIEGVFLLPLFILALLGSALLRPAMRGPVLRGLGVAALLALALGTVLLWGDGLTRLGAARFDEAWSRVLGLHQLILDNFTRIAADMKALELSSPIPSQGQNFAEIAFNLYVPVYLTGFVMLVIKTLSATYFWPLLAGWAGRWNRQTRWVVMVMAVYAFMLFLNLIAHDYSGERFVFALAFLLYPFVGLGAVRGIDWIGRRGARWRWWPVFYLVVLAAPLNATLSTLELEDMSSIEAGRWFAGSPWHARPILGNDARIAYAAGIPVDRSGNSQYLHFRPEDRNYDHIEDVAIQTNRALIFLKLRKKRLERMPPMTRYREIKRFEDVDKIVFVFASPDIKPEDVEHAR